jgi:hypothetical protein
MNPTVSSLRSHIGHIGKGAVQIPPVDPFVKITVLNCITLKPHLGHWTRGFVDNLSHSFSSAEWILGWGIVGQAIPTPQMRLFNIAHFCAVGYQVITWIYQKVLSRVYKS